MSGPVGYARYRIRRDPGLQPEDVPLVVDYGCDGDSASVRVGAATTTMGCLGYRV